MSFGRASALLALLLVSALPVVAEAAPCPLVPELRDVTINQGVGSYEPRVQGKDTLVRLYFALPSCAARNAYLTILTSGTSLRAKVDGTVVADAIPPVVASGSTEIGRVGSTAMQVDSPGDPKFVIPADALRRPADPGFTLAVEGTVRYQVPGSVPVSKTFTSLGSGQPIIAVFNRFSNSLRILVLPMGDARQPFSTQFTERTRATVDQGMQTLNRIYPVAKGVAPLGETPPGTPHPGLKYSVNPSVIDVGPTPWCGTSASFADLSSRLAATLQAWNSANPTAPADVALGVVDGALSGSGAAGCAEGMAAVNAPVAWVRAVPDGVTPSPAGALMAMEIAHTSALIPPPRGFGYHSTNIQADGTSPNRAYNLDTRQYLPDDHTVTRLYQPWHNNNTVLERDDWLYAVCKLTPGGPTNVECPTAGGVGGVVLDAPLVHMSGVTDGTIAGTSVSQSYVSHEGSVPLADEVSMYRLRQRAGARLLRDDGVAISSALSNHGAGGGAGPSVFTVTAPFDHRTTRLELVNTSTRPSIVLYSADQNLDPTGGSAPPGIIRIELEPGAPRNTTKSENVSEDDPALSDDGRLVAWVRSTSDGQGHRLAVGLADDPTVHSFVPGCDDSCADPAWSSDGRAMAFVQNRLGAGDEPSHRLLRIDVDPTKSPADPGFFLSSSPTVVYGNSTPGAALSRPTWSPGPASASTTSIAFEAPVSRDDRIEIAGAGGGTGRIRMVGALGDRPPEDLTAPEEDARAPAWSHTPGDSRIAYERWTDVCGDGRCTSASLVALDPRSGTTTVLLEGSESSRFGAPSWGPTGKIAFMGVGPEGKSVFVMEAFAGAEPKLIGTGVAPSIAGDRMAFVDFATNGQLDLFLVDLTERVTVHAGAPPGAHPRPVSELRLNLYLSCSPDSPRHPVAVSVSPSSTVDEDGGRSDDDGDRAGIGIALPPATESVARFSVKADTSLACGGNSRTAPVMEAVVSDGFLRSAPSRALPVHSVPKRPVVSISSPTAVNPGERGARPYLQGSSLRMVGSATDAEDGALSGDALEWFLDGGSTPVARGRNAEIPAPSPGNHSLVLRARDLDGNLGERERVFEVLADADRDGVPARLESCTSDDDPLDVFLDSAGDGSSNGDRYALFGLSCARSTEFEVSVDFDPDVLNARAQASTVTVTAGKVPEDWREIDPTTVRLVLPGAPGCAPAELPLATGGWRPGAPDPTTATAKFDHEAVTSYLLETCRLQGGRIPVTIKGASRPEYGPWTFMGYDTFLLR